MYLSYISPAVTPRPSLFRRHLPVDRTLPGANKLLDKEEFNQADTERQKNMINQNTRRKLFMHLYYRDVLLFARNAE